MARIWRFTPPWMIWRTCPLVPVAWAVGSEMLVTVPADSFPASLPLMVAVRLPVVLRVPVKLPARTRFVWAKFSRVRVEE